MRICKCSSLQHLEVIKGNEIVKQKRYSLIIGFY
jgi:hypothetical protein